MSSATGCGRVARRMRACTDCSDRELLGYQHSRAQFAELAGAAPASAHADDRPRRRAGRRRRVLSPTPGSAVWMTAPPSSASGTPTGRSTSSSRRWAPTRSPGMPLCELAGACVPLRDVFGRRGRRAGRRGCARRTTGTSALTWSRRSCCGADWPPAAPCPTRRWRGRGSGCVPATAPRASRRWPPSSGAAGATCATASCARWGSRPRRWAA